METENNKIKVAKFIWWIPHYRVPIFRRLSQNPFMDFTVYAGDNTQVRNGAVVASAAGVGNIEGVNWRRIGSRRIHGPLFKDYEWQREAVKIAWNEDFDVLISLGNKSLSNWLVWLICKLRRIPIIDWSQGVRGPESFLKWVIRKSFLRIADAHLLYGNFAREWYLKHGFRKDRVFTVYNSLDYEKQVSIREQIQNDEIVKFRKELGLLNGQDRLIFHSGRIEKKKKLSLLIDALKLLIDRGHKIVLIIIGSGKYEEALKQQVKENNMEARVVFYGACYDEVLLGRVMTASDLCIAPSAIGLLVMHSFVYGTPILTCDNSAHLHGPEAEAVIEGKTGGYFRDGDTEDLAQKMEQMLYPEPAKAKMTQNCMDIIDKYYNSKYQERIIIKAINSVLSAEKQVPEPD